MKYIIMCGGNYREWETPRQLLKVRGEPIVMRTIRLLRENGIKDIAISTNDPAFDKCGVPVLHHSNHYDCIGYNNFAGAWFNAFYPTNDPVCYIFGDVVFSPAAIRKIVETETDDIELFGSMMPFAEIYPKRWVEPFALKVVNTQHLWKAIEETRRLDMLGAFWRKPIMWELWGVIKGTPPGKKGDDAMTRDYTAINDYTCDIDHKCDIKNIEMVME